jgi:NAD(P)-dependent dehydrogenase (short-subunit alcohol dehydrogenase family)
VDSIKKQGGKAIFVKADVSEAKDAQNMISMAEKTFGKVNILFNNAGISHADDDDAIKTEEQVWDLTMKINLKGVFLGCKYGIPALRLKTSCLLTDTSKDVPVEAPSLILLALLPYLALQPPKLLTLPVKEEYFVSYL